MIGRCGKRSKRGQFKWKEKRRDGEKGRKNPEREKARKMGEKDGIKEK